MRRTVVAFDESWPPRRRASGRRIVGRPVIVRAVLTHLARCTPQLVNGVGSRRGIWDHDAPPGARTARGDLPSVTEGASGFTSFAVCGAGGRRQLVSKISVTCICDTSKGVTARTGSCAPPTHIQARESKWHRVDTHSGKLFCAGRSGTRVRELRISLAGLHTTVAISGCNVRLRLHRRDFP
jgi:hypothetical protein